MKKNCVIHLLYIYFFILFASLEANVLPAPFINSVNVITGLSESTDDYQYEYYIIGHNEVAGISLQLSEGDWRLGRIKTQKKLDDKSSVWQVAASFVYYQGYTEVYDSLKHKSVFRYSKDQLFEAVENYSKDSSTLYRTERFFWSALSDNPQLMSRVILDGSGQAYSACLFEYNENGQLIKETIAGNLSGTCIVPFAIDSQGFPKDPSIETYSINYEYSPYDPSLLIRQQEDSGVVISYAYDPKTKQCSSKLKGDGRTNISRCFYVYDEQGLLVKTILDDGSHENQNDLSGVTARQIIEIEPCRQGAALGQPQVVENKYLNLETGEEVLIEKTVHTFSEKGELLQKSFYDAYSIEQYSVCFSYDEQGQLIKTLDSRGESVKAPEDEFQYRLNSLKQKETLIDKYGNETSYSYDDFGRLIKTTFPSVLDGKDRAYKPKISHDYDILDHIIATCDGNGYETRTDYNIRGKPTAVYYPDGTEERFTYYLDGTIKENTNKSGQTKYFERDIYGRILKTEEQASNGNSINTLHYTYSGAALKSISDQKVFTVHFLYDGAGRQIGTSQETKDGIKKVEWDFDHNGQKNHIKEWFGPQENDYVIKVEEKNEHQQTIGMRIDDASGALQRKAEVQAPVPKEALFSQDLPTKNDRDQYVRMQEVVDASGMRQITTYDSLNRPENIQILNPFGQKISEKYLRHDANSNKVLEGFLNIQGDSIGKPYVIAWVYDSSNRIIAVQEQSGEGHRKCISYTYGSRGTLDAVTKSDGTTLHYTYNQLGHPIHLSASDHSLEYNYEYDEVGRLILGEDLLNGYAIKRIYNDFNELIEEYFPFAQGSNFNTYDLAGRRTSLTLPDASKVVYQYQGSFLKSIQRLDPNKKLTYIHNYQYDPVKGLLVASELSENCGLISYKYNSKSNLVGIIHKEWFEEIPDEGLDGYQRITRITGEDPAGITMRHFSYSSDGQLASEEGCFNHQFKHDSLHNCISKNNETRIVNELNQLQQCCGCEYKYDLNGNLVQKIVGDSTLTFQYDALNQLVNITNDNVFSIKYIYDPFQRRIGQICKTWDPSQKIWVSSPVEYFLYDGEKEIGRLNEKGEILELRILGSGKGAEIGAAIALELKNEVYIPIHDFQGSVRCLIDMKTKEIAEFYRYSAFGEEEIFGAYGKRLQHSEVENPWRYSSKRQDAQTGLIFFGKRYYDPSIGRWITPDPLLFYDNPNLYAYVQNNPISKYDLYGHFSIDSIWQSVVNTVNESWLNFKLKLSQFQNMLWGEITLPKEMTAPFENVGRKLLGNTFMTLMGHHEFEGAEKGVFGSGEVNDRVRVTFINGMLTTKYLLTENLELLSKTHGGVNIHYIFRPTTGFCSDLLSAVNIKMGYQLGFVSKHAYLLAKTWRELIEEMGGVGGGGTIIHYAHSLGGTDTDRAKYLMTAEELKMIRVITFGSATLVRNEGFASVINYISANDGISCFIVEPFGHVRNYFDPKSNVIWKSQFFFAVPPFPLDHLLSGKTYRTIVIDLGEQFLLNFTNQG